METTADRIVTHLETIGPTPTTNTRIAATLDLCTSTVAATLRDLVVRGRLEITARRSGPRGGTAYRVVA